MNHTRIHSLYSLIAICAVASSPVAFGAHNADAPAADAEFKAMDANADGRLSPAEHNTGAKKMFAAMDASKDGTVTVAEIDAANEKAKGNKDTKPHMSSAEMMKMTDTNGDGSLTTAEHAAAAVAIFAKMDGDKDGFVSQAECTAAHAQMMQKTGA